METRIDLPPSCFSGLVVWWMTVLLSGARLAMNSAGWVMMGKSLLGPRSTTRIESPASASARPAATIHPALPPNYPHASASDSGRR